MAQKATKTKQKPLGKKIFTDAMHRSMYVFPDAVRETASILSKYISQPIYHLEEPVLIEEDEEDTDGII